MTRNRMGGIVLLVSGATLAYFCDEASQSVGEQLHETLTGRFTDSTTSTFVLGGVAAAAGIGLLVFRR